MQEDRPATLSDVIRRHQEGLAIGEALLEQQVANDRRIKNRYAVIRDALNRDELKGAAVVDVPAGRVYFLDGGLVACLPFVFSDDVELDQEFPHDADHGSVVALGEAS